VFRDYMMTKIVKNLIRRRNSKGSDFPPCYTAYAAQPGNIMEAKTVVIFGAPRGGTTMVAGVAIKCGLFMGDDLPINCEDPAFNIMELKKRNLPIAPTIRETLKRRNVSSIGTWGWKFPRAAFYLDKVYESIVNPHFIIVYRDPLATASRAVQQDKPIVEALDQVLTLHRMNHNVAETYKVPTLFVSYDRAIAAREQTISSLCEFIGLAHPKNTKDILAYMEPGSYKEA
jgi:hypothetical protein